MDIIDLTHTFTNNMPVYPGDPPSTLEKIADVAADGFTDHKLTTAMHVGTHIDAPLHMINGGKKISEIDSNHLVGAGYLIDARNKKSIDIELLDNAVIPTSSIVVIYTDWSKTFETDRYYKDYPEITMPFAQKLVESGIKMIGMDTPSPDKPPYLVHKLLLQNNILIIENLTCLDQLLMQKNFEIIALPLKLDADSAPARVIARCSK